MKAHVKNGSDAAYNQEAHTLLALSFTRESNTVQEPFQKRSYFNLENGGLHYELFTTALSV